MTDRQTWHKNGLSIVEQNKRLEKNYILVHTKKFGEGLPTKAGNDVLVFSYFFCKSSWDPKASDLCCYLLANDFTKKN